MERRLASLLSDVQQEASRFTIELDAAREREAELACALEAERSSSRSREAILVDANARLLAQIEELSTALAKLQNQVMELTRSQNSALVSRTTATSAAAVASVSTVSHLGPPMRSSLESSSSGTMLGSSFSRRYLTGGEEQRVVEGVDNGDDTVPMRLSPVSSNENRTNTDLHIDALGGKSTAAQSSDMIRLSHSAAAVSSSVVLGHVGGGSGGGGGGGGGGESALRSNTRPDMGAGPADYDTSSLSSSGGGGNKRAIATSLSPTPAPPPPPPPLSTPEFFSLLTRHVTPAHLETLMAALGAFNRGKMGKVELLRIAEDTLRLPPSVTAANRGLPDLVQTFKSLILRVVE